MSTSFHLFSTLYLALKLREDLLQKIKSSFYDFTLACVFILKGMKVACTHFQSAAGIFQYLKVKLGYSVYFGA